MKKSESRSSAWTTLQYYATQWRVNLYYTLPCLLLTPVAIICNSFITSYSVSLLIDKLTTMGDYSFDNLVSSFWVLIVVNLIALLVGELSWRVVVYLSWRLETRAVYGLYRMAFSALSTQSMSFHHNRFGGSLVSAVNHFAGSYQAFTDTVIFGLMEAVLAAVISIVMITFEFPAYGLFLVFISLIFMVITVFSYKQVVPLQELDSKRSHKLSGILSDSISNILTVKSYGQEKGEQARFATANRKKQLAVFDVIRAITWRDTGFSLLQVVINFGLLLTMVFGHALWGISLGTLFLVYNLTGRLINSLWEGPHIMRRLNGAFAEASEMVELLEQPTGVVDVAGAPELKVTKGKIEFRGLAFTHEEKENQLTVFDKFELFIPSGQRLGLVGRSGSGKTTLTKLLLRFADLNEGSISIDGQNIAQITQESLRHQIAYVPQESTLFHRTLRENIAYGRPEASEQEVIRAAKLANAWEFIEKLPDGLNTLTGERGVKLSGGQRQRIVIARAILKDAPILVLDEATSALDSESEKLIQDALQKLMKGRTCIVIAHRLSTVSNLDRIVVLKDGKVVEDGTHQKLADGKGEYARLWHRQSGAFLG